MNIYMEYICLAIDYFKVTPNYRFQFVNYLFLRVETFPAVFGLFLECTYYAENRGVRKL